MAIAEKLEQKRGALKEKLYKKSQEQGIPKGKGDEINWAEWLLLFLGAGYIDILYIILALIGLIPYAGQAIYVVTDPVIDIVATGIIWFFLQSKGLGGYWWIAFGGGLVSLVPILNWIAWTVAVLTLYLLVKAEKVPLVGEKIGKVASVASKIKV